MPLWLLTPLPILGLYGLSVAFRCPIQDLKVGKNLVTHFLEVLLITHNFATILPILSQKFYSHKTYHVGHSIDTSKLTQLFKPEMLLLGQCHCSGYCLLWDVWASWLPQSSPSTSPLGSPWIQGPSLPGMTMPSLVSSSTGECTQYQVSGQSGSGTDGRSRIDQSMPSLWKTTTHPVSSMQTLLRCSRPSFMTPMPGQTCWQSLVQGVYTSMCCTKSGNLLSRPL